MIDGWKRFEDLEPEEEVSFTPWCPWSLTLHPGAEIVSEEPSGRHEVVDTMEPQVDEYAQHYKHQQIWKNMVELVGESSTIMVGEGDSL